MATGKVHAPIPMGPECIRGIYVTENNYEIVSGDLVSAGINGDVSNSFIFANPIQATFLLGNPASSTVSNYTITITDLTTGTILTTTVTYQSTPRLRVVFTLPAEARYWLNTCQLSITYNGNTCKINFNLVQRYAYAYRNRSTTLSKLYKSLYALAYWSDKQFNG